MFHNVIAGSGSTSCSTGGENPKKPPFSPRPAPVGDLDDYIFAEEWGKPCSER